MRIMRRISQSVGAVGAVAALVVALAAPPAAAQTPLSSRRTVLGSTCWVGVIQPYEYGGTIKGGGEAGCFDDATIVIEACLHYGVVPVFCSFRTGNGYVDLPIAIPACVPGPWMGSVHATIDGEPFFINSNPVNVVTCPL